MRIFQKMNKPEWVKGRVYLMGLNNKCIMKNGCIDIVCIVIMYVNRLYWLENNEGIGFCL